MLHEKLSKALSADNALGQLLTVVNDLKAEGLDQQAIYDVFAQFGSAIAPRASDADEDVLIDVLDRIVGWCSPQHRLFDTYLQT